MIRYQGIRKKKLINKLMALTITTWAKKISLPSKDCTPCQVY